MKFPPRFRLALLAAILLGPRVHAVAPEKSLETMLKPAFAQARVRPVRIMMGGTSIATFPFSNNQVFAAQLKAVYGDAREDVRRMAVINGSWAVPIQGWSRQPYSGPSFIRLRGEAKSLPLTFTGYGSKITVEYSRESNGGISPVSIDGATAGSINSSGRQQFSVPAVYEVPEGLHRLTLYPPAAGTYTYVERVTFEQNRPGIEVIDGTLGGSSLADVFSANSRGGVFAPPVSTQPGVGLAAYFERPDIDLVIWSGPVNDFNVDFATWKARMDQVVEATRPKSVAITANAVGSASVVQTATAHGLKTGDVVTIAKVGGSVPAINGARTVTVLSPTTFSVPVAVTTAGRGGVVSKAGRPLILIVEMGGYFSMPTDANHASFLQKRDYLRKLGRDHDHVFTLDWHGATADTDIVRYAAKYYTAGTPVVVDPQKGTFSGDFIHPNAAGHQVALNLLCESLDLPIPAETEDTTVHDRIRKTSPLAPRTPIRFLDGTTWRTGYAAELGAAVFSEQTYIGTQPLIFSEKVTNLADTNAQIAAAATGDRFGKYLDCSQVTSVPIFERVAVGERVTVTAAVKPPQPGYLALRPPPEGAGTMYYKSAVLTDCSTFLYNAEESPMWVTFEYVRGQRADLWAYGRIYSLSVTHTHGQAVSTESRLFNLDADLETQAATEVTATGATLNAAVRSDGNGTLSACFDFGTTRRLAARSTSRNAIIADDGTLVGLEQPIVGLKPATTYYFRVRAMSAGNPLAQPGKVLWFRTPAR